MSEIYLSKLAYFQIQNKTGIRAILETSTFVNIHGKRVFQLKVLEDLERE